MNLDFALWNATNVRLNSPVLIFLILIASQAVGKTNDPVSASASEVTARVTLFQTSSADAAKDASEVIIWLVPLDMVQKVRLDTELPHYRMMQHNKAFEPHVLVVSAGSIVEFPNHDPWFRNVFSVSNSRRFDLGLYQAGARKAVRFDRAGASYVFCNIHPEMMAVILSVESTYFAVSDKTGHLSIGNVPLGRYLLHAWYENATRQALEALQRCNVRSLWGTRTVACQRFRPR
jgi:plastocyanin